MKQLLIIVALLFSVTLQAQVSKVNLQASGLTCSMCSNAIFKALKTLPFVEKVDPNIKTSSFDIHFKEGAEIDFEKIKSKVEEAGFAVAKFVATVNFNNVKMLDDNCIFFGSIAFHFVNPTGQLPTGIKSIKIMDKGFISAKEFKKNGIQSKGSCNQRIGEPTAKVYTVTI